MPVPENEQNIIDQMEEARKNGVHIDVAVNPFIEEADRQAILEGLAQDPEWD